MRRRLPYLTTLAACLAAGALASATGAEERTGPPVLVVDQAHQALETNPGTTMPGSRVAEPYVIDPAHSVILDYSKAKLRFKSGDPKTSLLSPNRIDVILEGGKARWHSVVSARDLNVELGTDTLRPGKDTSVFRGFASGATYLITIGYEFPRKAGEEKGLTTLAWAGKVQVKGEPIQSESTKSPGEPPPPDPDRMGDQ